MNNNYGAPNLGNFSQLNGNAIQAPQFNQNQQYLQQMQGSQAQTYSNNSYNPPQQEIYQKMPPSTQILPMTLEAMVNEIQALMMAELSKQNAIIDELAQKNRVITENATTLFREVSNLRCTLNGLKQPKILPETTNTASTTGTSNDLTTSTSRIPSDNTPTSPSNPADSTGNPDGDWLLRHISHQGSGVQNFKFELKNDEDDFPKLLYRERNFKVSVHLVDGSTGERVTKHEKIQLGCALYTCESPPKYLHINTAGNKILKGVTETELINGKATFNRLQINDVTSHFRNGWLFLVIFPKKSRPTNPQATETTTSPKTESEASGPSEECIKPMVIEKLVVKAKKMKGPMASGPQMEGVTASVRV